MVALADIGFVLVLGISFLIEGSGTPSRTSKYFLLAWIEFYDRRSG